MKAKSSNDQPTAYHCETRRQRRIVSEEAMAMAKAKQSQQFERIHTPLRQISELQIKSQVKRPKLFSSKSLSRLVTRTLFFAKPAADNDKRAAEPANKLPTTKSFPCNSTANFRWQTNPFLDGFMENSALKSDDFVNRVNSESLIGLGSTSTMLEAAMQLPVVDCTLEQPNLSPIIGAQETNGRVLSGNSKSSSSVPITMSSTRVVYSEHVADSTGSSGIDAGDEHQVSSENDRNSSNNSDKSSTRAWKSKATKLSKPFKNTTIVLRDVKNSLGLVSEIACAQTSLIAMMAVHLRLESFLSITSGSNFVACLRDIV